MVNKIESEPSLKEELTAIRTCLKSQLLSLKAVSNKMTELLGMHDVFSDEFEDIESLDEFDYWSLNFENEVEKAQKTHTMIHLLVARRSELQERSFESSLKRNEEGKR